MTRGQLNARIGLMRIEDKDIPVALVVSMSDYKCAMQLAEDYENLHVELDVELKQDDWYLIGTTGVIQ